MQEIRILELFAGIGACSKAFEKLNILHKIVASNFGKQEVAEQIEDGSEEGFEQLDLSKEDEGEKEVEQDNNSQEKKRTPSRVELNDDFVDSFYKKHKKLIDELGE